MPPKFNEQEAPRVGQRKHLSRQRCNPNTNPNVTRSESGKGEKVRTLDIAPVGSELPSQKRSGMARVLKGFHSFTCTPTRSSAIGMSHACLCLPSRSWYSFTDPQRDGRLSRPWCEVAQAEMRTCNLPIANPALYHTTTIAHQNLTSSC